MNIINIEKINNGDELYLVRKKLNENFQAVAGTNNLFKGYHIDLGRLNLEYPPANNQKGWFAFVGTTFPLTIYKVVDNGGSWWETAGKVPGPDIDLSFFAEHGGYEGTLKDLDKAKVDKVDGKSLVSDAEILKLSKLPSIDDLNKYLGDKADKVVNEKSVVYATDGDITKEVSFLASDTQNGLLSKEQNKFINDLIKEYPKMEEQLKRIASSTGRLDDQFILILENIPSTVKTLPNTIKTTTLEGAYRLKTNSYELQGYESAPLTKSFPVAVTDTKATVDFRAEKLTHFEYLNDWVNSSKAVGLIINSANAKSVTLNYMSVSVFVQIINAPEVTHLYFMEIGLTSIDLTKCPKLKHAQIHKNKYKSLDFSNNPLIEVIYCQGNTLLETVTLPTSNINLKTIYASNLPAMTKESFIAIGNAWNDRTGKPAGSFSISSSVYDSMTEEERAIFTNKNINIVAS